MSKTPHLIGLTGYARSGKDTVALLLTNLDGYEQFAFADILRLALETLDPLIGDNRSLAPTVAASGWDSAKTDRIVGHEVRRLLQAMGDTLRTLFGDDALLHALDAHLSSAQTPTVISDVRFPHEAQWVRDRGGVIWRIDRPGVGPLNSHVTETSVTNIEPDRVIVNDGSIHDLWKHISASLTSAAA